MHETLARQLSASAADFRRLVWPRIAPWLGGGNLVPVETVTDSRFAAQTDMLAGVDAWHVDSSRGMRGIASRVQWCESPWNTFTVRMWRSSGKPTEIDKRRFALNDARGGWLFPIFTVQAYVWPKTDGQLLSVAMMFTHDLVRLVDCDFGYEKATSSGDAGFRVVTWHEVEQAGCWIRTASGSR